MSSGGTALEELEQNLERSIENVRQIRIVVSDFQPQGQPGLNQKLQQIVKDLQEIDKLRPKVQDIQVRLLCQLTCRKRRLQTRKFNRL